jgi:hypothetical protein
MRNEKIGAVSRERRLALLTLGKVRKPSDS